MGFRGFIPKGLINLTKVGTLLHEDYFVGLCSTLFVSSPVFHWPTPTHPLKVHVPDAIWGVLSDRRTGPRVVESRSG